ncbi:hypothetical protein TraAM80_05816 [Trypanosoma rangeli]|uniref:Uncharacterized protein n=1 Tax=Trypanosoma rangeli TaxID=5698 RepID=A0A422NCY9_TRYRA|nr:uncharacterized protein TraAM80_05816 [Trypanosoma rangeli]RNF03370.1 hypothetical protein TraAM80_05816 [Trypanosoma rangeli]|eukprot:RNF03370.1 hypothetical protein TraAM80_05816 [Trypanosoma rangeli]
MRVVTPPPCLSLQARAVNGGEGKAAFRAYCRCDRKPRTRTRLAPRLAPKRGARGGALADADPHQPVAVAVPRIHSGNALRCLSVVSVDWDKIVADAARVPVSYVRAGVWSGDGALPQLLYAWRKIRGTATRLHFRVLRDRGVDGNGASREVAQDFLAGDPCDGRNGTSGDTHTTGDEARGRSTGLFPAALGSPSRAGYVNTSMLGSAAGAEAQKEFLNELMRTAFYKFVFRGHHVAINCLGSWNFFTRSTVDMVDYRYAIAFAKMVRIFNCMVHAEPSGEEEMLMDKQARMQDSVL